jgi:hypothetical protein
VYKRQRVKRLEKPKSFSKLPIIITISVLFVVAVIVLISLSLSDNFSSFSSPSIEISAEGNKNIIRVPAGGNLQAAINKANSGDIIELQAGATYTEITLPKKNSADFVTIQTSAVKQLPEDQRVSPKQSKLMAKIITRGKGKPAVSTEDGASHYRFIGIEFAPSNSDYIYNLIYLAASTDKVADVPHDFEFDRCYVRSISDGVTRRGLALNSANTIVKNSYFEGFAYPQQETQGICGWTGTKNVKILNNYIEGGAENVMFGGSDPANAELIPQDIEIRGNHFNKPAAWKDKYSLKCLFELKNAKRVQFVGNYLENNWVGSAFRITVRNQDGDAPFSTIEDVLIKDNIINGSGEGINVLGKDDIHPSQTMKNLTITNNLFLNLDGEKFAGSGYFLQINDGENILIANNTAFNRGNIATFYDVTPRNFIFRDNITGYGEYGIHGLGNVKAASVQKLFQNNVFINNRKVPNSDFIVPPNNFTVQDIKDVGFANSAQNDFNLLPGSKFKSKGSNKSDIGSDLGKLPFNLLKAASQ